MMNKAKKLLTKIIYCLTITVLALIYGNCYASVEILNVRYWTAPDHTRIVLDVDNESVCDVRESENLLILNFKDASLNKSIPTEIILNKPGIKKLVFYHIDKGGVKIELILDKYRKAEVFKLKKFQDRPDRVVVDIFLQEATVEEIAEEQIPMLKQKKIIVIDPGHGGDDPGAVAKRGVYEKNIVLSISREIKKEINKMPGYRAVLTREGDYYVSFNKRLKIAKNLDASLFISVHADAAKNRKAKGSSVYCLSTSGASNEAAKLLANNENLSDIIGGVPNGEGKNESGLIILNMFQTNTINLSKTYADTLMNHLNSINSLKYKSVQEAPFNVLKLPDIPAVLIETAYISNPQEENLLRNRNFQKKLAVAVASSVREYLSGTASISQSNDALKNNYEINDAGEKQAVRKNNKEITTIYYEIKRGDTLHSVARHFNTKVAVLLNLNNLKLRDQLFVGRKILVPANKTGDNEFAASDQKNKYSNRKKTSRIYKVKKGDTLFSLAKQNSITVQELCKLNNMKSSDPLLYGQKIKLP
jgi:N-acetylmuramoyl-L-alanine amidase